MLTAKGKDGSTSHRNKPVSEFDDATLAQKREYWRIKKREQRARLTERRGKRLHTNCSGSYAASSAALPNLCESYNHVIKVKDNFMGADVDQKEEWLQTVDLNKVSPSPSTSCSVSVRTAEVDTTMAVMGAGIRAVTSPTAGQIQVNISSVPPSSVTTITNGSSTETPQPCVSMQGAISPKTEPMAQVESCINPELSPSNETTRGTYSPPTANTSPQRRTNSALVTSQRAEPDMESEEEKTAKRRENWRIKKREQRARSAARLAKARERKRSLAGTSESKTARVAGPKEVKKPGIVQPRMSLRRNSQNQCHTQVHSSFMSSNRENHKLQSGRSVARVKVQADQVRVHNPDRILVGRARETQRKLPTHVHLLNVSQRTVRCRTPQQRFIDAQKTLNQRNIQCISSVLPSFINTRNIPEIDPNDTPEQIIAKRREYWRIKKREQRAKLSMETRARMKEKECVNRRVKRYQKIIERLRMARANTSGISISNASETIGGFIKEDGTVTINIPTNCSTAEAYKRKNVAPVRVTLPPPRPVQVKISLPPAGFNRPQGLYSTKLRTESTNVTQADRQLKLSHPQTHKTASPGGSSLGGCVMKMAVTSSFPLPSSCLYPEMAEEERMAKKREYWRIKKREQRAARTARVMQGQARALQKMIMQKQATMPLEESHTNETENAQSYPGSSLPDVPNLTGIKQEAEVDLHFQPEQAICPDIKPPSSPMPPEQETDPDLSADSQATTLLAVASMKKLLEESLSNVTECKSTSTEVKTEDEASEPETKPDPMEPIALDLIPEIESLMAESDASLQTDTLCLDPKYSPQSSKSLSPIPAPNLTCESSTQTVSNFIINPSVNTSDGPSSPSGPQRILNREADHDGYCSQEPPKLHHLPLNQPQPEQRPSEEPTVCKINSLKSLQGTRDVVTAHGGLSSLQRKREYWKLMKRQQRARSKARQVDRAGQTSRQRPQRNNQAPGGIIPSSVKGGKPPVRPRVPAASGTAASSVPSVLMVSPGDSNSERSPSKLQVKLPVNRTPCSQQRTPRPSQTSSDVLRTQPNQKQTRKCNYRSTDVDSTLSLPTLKPPENPLTRINLQPIEPPPQTSPPTLSPIRIPHLKPQTPPNQMNKPLSISTLAPPRKNRGESEEEFLKRKREYWRIKKKEQRARKAVREKEYASRKSSNNWRTILPAQELHLQDSGQEVNSSEETEQIMSSPVDAEPSSFSFQTYTAPLEEETELAFMDFENGGEDAPLSDAVWRSRYLMDFDPLNQLLVCMVCGEQQYSHCVEGVRAHIEEAHPDTLNLDPVEHQGILEAWDEQVSQRERFFTSQLQRNSQATTEPD